MSARAAGARLRATLAAATCLALLQSLSPAGASAAPVRELPGPRLGMVGMAGNGVPGESVVERAAAYRKLRRAGVRAVRVDIGWTSVEPIGEPLRDYDFKRVGREVRAIERAGLGVIGILAYGHPDYSRAGAAAAATPLGPGLPPFGLAGARAYPPDDPADFARYARATARHFGEEVIAWEVWNEENEGWRFWAPREDPRAYGELLCATHTELKEVDPDTPVVFGGLFFPAVAGLPGMSATDFLAAAYDADPNLGRCFDAMAYHPYPYPFTAPELEAPVRGSVLSAAEQMQEVLDRHGDGDRPLWITEVGWPTNRAAYGVSERKQAQYVARMQAATFARGIPVLTWYTYGDEEDPSDANQEAAFGFFDAEGKPKPAYQALRTFAGVFRGMRFRRDLSKRLKMPAGEPMTGGRGFALRFRGRDRGGARSTVTALWHSRESLADAQGPAAPEGNEAPVVEVEIRVRGSGARLVGHLGARRRVRARRGVVRIEVGPAPVYLLDRLGPPR